MSTAHPARWRAAIVDLDGTLIDTLGDFEAAVNAALASLALPAVGRAFVRDSIGKGSRHLLLRTLQAVGAPADRLDEFWGAYQREYAQVNGRHAALYPGTLEGLAMLRAHGLRMACLTNKPLAFAEPLLEMKGLRGFFGPVFGGDSFPRSKPDPLPMRETCAALACAPGEALAIGDSSNDAESALAAGCAVILLRHGYNHGAPVEGLGATAVLDRLDQIEPWLAAG